MKPPSWLRLYPRPWRERYGDELVALIDDTGRGWRQILNILRSAAEERTICLVRRALGIGREDAVIHKFGRGVVHAVAAWAAATMVMVIGAVVIQFVRAMSIFHTWDAVQRQGWFLWSAFDVYLAGFRAAVFLIVSLPIVAPVVMLFKRTDAGRARPLAARLVTVATSAVVGLFWQLMLPPYNRLSVQLCLSLAAGGTVIARAWFPLSAGASTSPAPLACE